MRLQPSGIVRQHLCNHVFKMPRRYSKIHSVKECRLCGYEVVIPTPEHLKPEPDWINAKEEL